MDTKIENFKRRVMLDSFIGSCISYVIIVTGMFFIVRFVSGSGYDAALLCVLFTVLYALIHIYDTIVLKTDLQEYCELYECEINQGQDP